MILVRILGGIATCSNDLEQGFPTFLCLRPPTDINVPKISLIWYLSRLPRGTRPPGWEPLH